MVHCIGSREIFESPSAKKCLPKIKKPYLTSLIMKQTTLAHGLFCDIAISLKATYLPYSFLSSTTPFYASLSKGAASTIFYTFGMVGQPDLNPKSPVAGPLPNIMLFYCLVVVLNDEDNKVISLNAITHRRISKWVERYNIEPLHVISNNVAF